MPKKLILLLFLAFWIYILPVCGQDVAFSGQNNLVDWQEQILQQADIESLGDEGYNQLLEELSDLIVWSDTTQQNAFLHHPLLQRIIWSSNRCLSPRSGYTNVTDERQQANKAYLGDPWHHSMRYRLQFGDRWHAGFSLEKDAGEAWNHSIPYFDSWHGYLRYHPTRHHAHSTNQRLYLSDAIVGHYRLRMGCGLLIQQGFSLGKQYLSQQILSQRTNQISPFASNAESQFMQGVAADLRWGNHLSLLPYFSARQIDGTLNENNILTALQTDGNHRTFTEMSHRQTAWQWTSGARLGWRGEWYDVGIHATYTQLQYDYQRSRIYYNANVFRGHQLAQFSTDYTFRALGALVRGELAIDDHGAIANLTALQYRFSDRFTTSLVYRYFDRHYRQLHASALSESSTMQGEQGVTLNLETQLSRHWQLQGMADYFHFNQPQFGIRDSTSQGFEGLIRAIYSRSNTQFSMSYRMKHKAQYYRHTVDGILTLPILSSLTSRTQLRARLHNEQAADLSVSNSVGYAISQSLAWRCNYWQKIPFTIDGQASYFHTDDYDSRLYLTERTVLYGFGLPVLFGQGVRYSITNTIKLGKRINLDLKYALTNYANRHSIGSGLQEIPSNTQQDLWLQMRISL